MVGRCDPCWGDLRSPARLPDGPRGNARRLGRGPAQSSRHPAARLLLVGGDGIDLEDFLLADPERWFPD